MPPFARGVVRRFCPASPLSPVRQFRSTGHPCPHPCRSDTSPRFERSQSPAASCRGPASASMLAGPFRSASCRRGLGRFAPCGRTPLRRRGIHAAPSSTGLAKRERTSRAPAGCASLRTASGAAGIQPKHFAGIVPATLRGSEPVNKTRRRNKKRKKPPQAVPATGGPRSQRRERTLDEGTGKRTTKHQP